MLTIRDSYERQRGCGHRKGGGLYLVGGRGEPCGKLPLPLEACPTCGGGIRFSRGWKWVAAPALFKDREGPCGPANPFGAGRTCWSCPAAHPESWLGRCGLMWVGEKFYTPEAFTLEAEQVGVSKRLAQIPTGFKPGETWVLLAHRKAFSSECACFVRGHDPNPPEGHCQVEGGHGTAAIPCDHCNGTGYAHRPGVFYIFRPRAVEYVLRGDEADAELERLVKRGVELVRVHPVEADGQMRIEA